MEEVKDTTVGYIKFCDCCYPSKKFTNRQKFYEHKNPRVRMSKKTGSIPDVEVKGSSVSSADFAPTPSSILKMSKGTKQILETGKIASKFLTKEKLFEVFNKELDDHSFDFGEIQKDALVMDNNHTVQKTKKSQGLRDALIGCGNTAEQKQKFGELDGLPKEVLIQQQKNYISLAKACGIHVAAIETAPTELELIFQDWVKDVSNRRDNGAGQSQDVDVDYSLHQFKDYSSSSKSSSSNKRSAEELEDENPTLPKNPFNWKFW